MDIGIFNRKIKKRRSRKKPSSISRVVDYRWIYLMRYGKTNKYKIGIAANQNTRRTEIDHELPEKKVTIICCYKIFFAESNEKGYLHKKYERYRFIFRGAGKGKTEWFKLPFYRALQVQADMWTLHMKQRITILLSLTLLIFIFLNI